MLVQLSSGQGPCECEIGVKKFYESLCKEFSTSLIQNNSCKFCDGFSSVIFETENDLSFLEGTVEWKCKSFLRPNHKRKNWFIDISILDEKKIFYDESKILQDTKIQFFHCGGNGGQNVNKVETGVRLIHEKSGTTVTASEERTQMANRRIAEKKLILKIKSLNEKNSETQNQKSWMEHKKIVRGNPVRIYEGENFRRIK